ncbi:MAG: oligosaccharide flippase family protein [Armatimonadetes bacterium]|nr:oligosaccharide flippase family protein [Armatimonadota bacterium]
MLSSLKADLRRTCQSLKTNRFAHNVSALTTSNVWTAALNVVQGILVARWLGPELYGVAALVMVYPGFIFTFFDARSSDASMKYLGEFHTRGDQERVLAMCKLGYIVDLTIASFAFLVVSLSSGWAALRIAHHPETAGLIVLYCAAHIPLAFKNTSYAVLATLGKFPLIARLDAALSVLRVIIIVVLVGAGWQVAGVIWGHVIASAMIGLLYGTVAYRMIRCHWHTTWLAGKWGALKGRRREILGFIAYSDINALLGVIPKQLDVLLLGYFCNPTEAGYYKLAKTLSSSVGYLVGPLQSVTYRELVRLSGLEDRAALRRKIQVLAVRVGIPMGFLVAASALLVPSVLSAMVGHTFVGAVKAAQIMLFGAAIWMAFFWLKPMYLALGAIKTWVGINVYIVCLTLIGFFVVIPYGGYLSLSALMVFLQLLSFGVGTYKLKSLWR